MQTCNISKFPKEYTHLRAGREPNVTKALFLRRCLFASFLTIALQTKLVYLTSILEVLTVAITRHVILSHDDPWSNMACIACIAGLFAIRRFLIRRSELKEEMVEMD